jgi:Spy/CpxP family protein refolding chaperone
MEIISSNKWQLRVATIIVFLLGFCAGGLSLHLYEGRYTAASESRQHRRFGEIFEQLNLTAAQRVAVEKIMNDARTKFKELHQQSEPQVEAIRNDVKAQMEKVLTPPQWQQFQQLMAAKKERHRAGRHHDNEEKNEK